MIYLNLVSPLFLFSSCFIVIIYFFSLLTCLLFFKIKNAPFINPSKQYDMIYINKKVFANLNFIFYSMLNHNIMYIAFIENRLLHDGSFYSFLSVMRFIEMAKYIVLIEMCYYTIHRLFHTPLLYKYIHSHHHKSIEIYPVDAMDSDYIDNLGFTLSLNVPLFFIPLNYHEYSLLNYFYFTGIILVHSDVITNYHRDHHKYFKRNFFLLGEP